MNTIKGSAKAIAGVAGAAYTVLGFYLEWPPEIVSAVGVVLTGVLVWAIPNKPA